MNDKQRIWKLGAVIQGFTPDGRVNLTFNLDCESEHIHACVLDAITLSGDSELDELKAALRALVRIRKTHYVGQNDLFKYNGELHDFSSLEKLYDRLYSEHNVTPLQSQGGPVITFNDEVYGLDGFKDMVENIIKDGSDVGRYKNAPERPEKPPVAELPFLTDFKPLRAGVAKIMGYDEKEKPKYQCPTCKKVENDFEKLKKHHKKDHGGNIGNTAKFYEYKDDTSEAVEMQAPVFPKLPVHRVLLNELHSLRHRGSYKGE